MEKISVRSFQEVKLHTDEETHSSTCVFRAVYNDKVESMRKNMSFTVLTTFCNDSAHTCEDWHTYMEKFFYLLCAFIKKIILLILHQKLVRKIIIFFNQYDTTQNYKGFTVLMIFCSMFLQDIQKWGHLTNKVAIYMNSIDFVGLCRGC